VLAPAEALKRSREEQAARGAVGQAARHEMRGLSCQTDEARLQRIRALADRNRQDALEEWI